MRLLAVVASVLLAGSAFAQGLANVDAEYGFLGVRLLTTPESFTKVETSEEVGRWLTLKDTRAGLRYANFNLDEVKYNFLWRKLYSIHIEVSGKKATRGVLAALLAQYGPPTSVESQNVAEANTIVETREWKGKKAYLLYKHALNGKGGQIVVVDRAQWDKMEAPRVQQRDQSLKWMQGSFLKGDFDLKGDR
ncbi:MAG: hypothetical protein JSR82_06700 [Verrucomicrobia bacterium]|nr:hypothetical protein [Verrucomicrobiota bacterium]